MKNLKYIKLSMIVIPLLLITACGEDPENEDNHLPTVSILTDDKSQTVNVGEKATVGAKATDVDDDPLSYLWRIKSKPSGSEAQLSNSRTKEVSIVTDKSGDYILSFVANDGFSDSKTVTATVHASTDDPIVSDIIDEDDKKDESKESDRVINRTGIVGGWTLDFSKAEKIVNRYEEDDLEGFFLSFIIMSMKDIQFKEDGTCTIPEFKDRDSTQKCWEADGDKYIFYGDNGEPSGTIEVSDNILKIKFNEDKDKKIEEMELEYTPVDNSTLVPPSVVMKKDRVYHARDVEMKEFHVYGSGYFIFTGERDFYHLTTEKLNSLSLEELKEIKAKDERDEGGFLIETGAYQVNKGIYSVKENTFYTGIDIFTEKFNEGKIEIISESHIKFGGYDYYLE